MYGVVFVVVVVVVAVVGMGRGGVTGNRTVLNNTLNARDGRYPRATAPNICVQPYIMYYNIIITVLGMRKKSQIRLMGTIFFGLTSSQEKNERICLRKLAETKRTIVISIHILKYYNRYYVVCTYL